jgi:hypothetical protein
MCRVFRVKNNHINEKSFNGLEINLKETQGNGKLVIYLYL